MHAGMFQKNEEVQYQRPEYQGTNGYRVSTTPDLKDSAQVLGYLSFSPCSLITIP